ncbi:MAG: tRNA pseudouridine(55) synthase TruB [Chloroherpetonaceae bacterium]|nr:tRNA pseudouridine(55) synthase TruB [Chloroherpetonaceae bacterium]
MVKSRKVKKEGLPQPEGEIRNIDKPLGWTSFDAVAKIRNAYSRAGVGKVRVGHAGTLDPLATGVLIVASGKQTKKIAALEHLDKEYEAVIRLGVKTPSFDGESEEYDHRDISSLRQELIEEVIRSFEGRQEQMPPMFSATWHQGKRLYEIARAGRSVERKPKPIEIFAIELLSYQAPEVVIRVRVSKGTYIRALANDIGEKLGVGAYLRELRRTKVGDFVITDSKPIEKHCEEILNNGLSGKMIRKGEEKGEENEPKLDTNQMNRENKMANGKIEESMGGVNEIDASF